MNTLSVLCSTLSMVPQPVLLSMIRTDTRVNAFHKCSRDDRLQPLPGPIMRHFTAFLSDYLNYVTITYFYSLSNALLSIHCKLRGMSSEGVVR